MTDGETTDPESVLADVREETGTVLIGNDDVIEVFTISLLTGGHVLLEGVPGVAKTTMANLFAEATGLEYNRIQMTPDLVPADITGTQIYRENRGEFELRKGPVFANVVVADEINRTTPKTQSALLEAMQEGTVTIEGETLDLPDPFFVVATQNPIEMEGTWELPEAQRDRFQLKLVVDLPDRDVEKELLDRFDDAPNLGPEAASPVVTRERLLAAREQVEEVYVDDSIKEYVLDLVAATRENPDVKHGASPRASLAFLRTAKARAAVRGRDYVIPDDVKSLAGAVLSHRLVLSTDAGLRDVDSDDVVGEILSSVTPPTPQDTVDADTGVASDGGDPAEE